MSDIEAPIRRHVVELLESFCECKELVRVTRGDGRAGEVDVLLLPKEEGLEGVSLAIEVKANRDRSGKMIAPWIKQAADYVGARPSNGWPVVAAAFIWLPGISPSSDVRAADHVYGMIQLAQQFRVGVADFDEKGRITLRFGPGGRILVGRTVKPWLPSGSDLLFARRTPRGRADTYRISILML